MIQPIAMLPMTVTAAAVAIHAMAALFNNNVDDDDDDDDDDEEEDLKIYIRQYCAVPLKLSGLRHVNLNVYNNNKKKKKKKKNNGAL